MQDEESLLPIDRVLGVQQFCCQTIDLQIRSVQRSLDGTLVIQQARLTRLLQLQSVSNPMRRQRSFKC